MRHYFFLPFLAGLCLTAVPATPVDGSPDSFRQGLPRELEPPRRGSGRVRVEPYQMVNGETLFGHLEALTTIRPFAGWRNSASAGESEAIDYVVAQLAAMENLVSWGLEIERRPFHTFSGTEFRETRVLLTVDGAEIEVPAFGVSGHRDHLWMALSFDSDGRVNDSEPDPVEIVGEPWFVRSTSELNSLPNLQGRVAVIDFALFDRSVVDTDTLSARVQRLLGRQPEAIVPVTSFSNVNGVSHGSFAGDLPVWALWDAPLPPILNLRLEDLGAAGVHSWADLDRVDSVRVVWDMDVYSPGSSEYLVARIPGANSAQAVIIGAHIDSPNNPGGIDDGSGSVTVLQVAEALDAARFRPPTDLYLVWFGSHERGLYGSSSFVADHQELLDRTIAMLQIDCLSVPVDGVTPFLNLEAWSYSSFGADRFHWPRYLEQQAGDRGISARPLDYHGLVSDNSNFNAWAVPNLNLIFMDPYDPTEVHYAGHMHDPYDSADFVRSEEDTLVEMATIAVVAAVETGRDLPDLRPTPPPDRRAVFVASHTEAAHMTPTHLVDFSMALAWGGFDVDMIPYGREVTAEDLAGADLVVALPVHDYPSAESDVDLYDEAWSGSEVDALEDYVRAGGLLVMTNSLHRLKYYNLAYEHNEDWPDMNVLGRRFGVEFTAGGLQGDEAVVSRAHPLVDGVERLVLADGNGVRFTFDGGQVLARVGGEPALYLRPAGNGEVLVLADLGMLNGWRDGEVRRFGLNLADYARTR